MPHHVVYCFDKNYEAHFGASVMSLMLNYQGPGEDLHIHLITEHKSPEFLEKLDRLRQMFRCTIGINHPSSQQMALLIDLKLNSIAQNYLTRASWLRLLIPAMLNDSIDQVLYLDADTIVQESVSHLLDSCGNESALYGAPDLSEIKLKLHHDIDRYINSGVMVMGLKTWRKNNHLAGCLEAAQTHAAKLLYADQCAINLCLAGTIQALDPRWNQFIQSGSNLKPLRGGILHFLTKSKPWQRWFDHPLGEIYWHYRRVSPWAEGEAQEPRLLSDNALLARKLSKEGNHVQAQLLYENIISTLKKHIK